MSEDDSPILPDVLWAQTPEHILLTFCVDCENPTVKIEPETMYFKGVGETERKEYEITIHFFGEIDPESSVHNSEKRHYKVVLAKKVCRPFWPRLNKEMRKPHWLKIDFNQWIDEEEWDIDNSDQENDIEKKVSNIEEEDLRGDGQIVDWTQTPGHIFLTFELDCKNPTVKIEPESMYFKGVGEEERKEYEVTIYFFGEIDPESAEQSSSEGFYEVRLSKKQCRIFWPRLNTEKLEFPWLIKVCDNWKNAEEWNTKNSNIVFLNYSDRQYDMEKSLRYAEEMDLLYDDEDEDY